MFSKVVVLKADPQDANRWEMSEFASADEAQALVESLITSGVGPESLRVLNGTEMAISVTLTPVVEISRQGSLDPESRPADELETDDRFESTIPEHLRITDDIMRGDEAVRFRGDDASVHVAEAVPFAHLFRTLGEGLVGVGR